MMSLHPLLLAIFAAALLSVVGIIGAFFVRGGLVRAVIIVVSLMVLLPSGYVLCQIFAPELVDARFRTYGNFYRDIQPGMTREDVYALMDRHYPVSGERKKPKVLEDIPPRLAFFMNPENSSEPNCEGIFLTMEEGKVVEKDYSRD